MNQAILTTEKTILGTVLYNPEALHRIGSSLKAEDFYFPEHQEIWKAISVVKLQQLDVNVLSLLNYLSREKPDYNADYLDELVTHYHVDVDSALTFSAQLGEEAGRRSLDMELEVLSKDVKKGTKSFTELLSHLNGIVDKISTKSFAPTELFGTTLATDFLNKLDLVKSDYSFIGIKEIDDVIFDFNPGEVIIVAARPGVGKTASLLQSVRVQVQAGRTVGFLALEMPESKILQRLISAKSGVAGNEIARMSSEQFTENMTLVECLEFYTQNEQLIIDTGAPYDIDTIERVMRKMKYTHNVDVIYIDYIQLIGGSRTEKNENRQQQISTISRRVKNLASELEIRVVMAAQLNREAVRRGTGPLLSDLRDSGALEQDASMIIFLYPFFPPNMSADDEENMLQTAETLNVKFDIAKQRNGPVRTFDVQFVKAVGVFQSRYEGFSTDYSIEPAPF